VVVREQQIPAMGTWLGVAIVLLSVLASAHVILHKRDSRAATGWVGLIWLAPGIGALLYVILGVNRIRRRAIALGRARRPAQLTGDQDEAAPGVAAAAAGLAGLARLGAAVSGRPLLAGNRVTSLSNGDAAYPAMLAAIEQATTSVTLSSFIFAADDIGRRFVDALARATRRGVQVRVLVDAAGVGYSRPPIHRVLRHRGVPAALFLPVRWGLGLAFFNLRNHRKILVCDGRVGFSGGMNIRDLHVVAAGPRHATRDVQFRVDGPVVRQLQEVFAEDWAFATREVLDGPAWFPDLVASGPTAARVLSGGPDVDFEVARTVLLGALAAARESVAIVTPYFLPDQSMIAALAVTALRGVRVDIVLPERGNIAMVQWATRALLWQVLGSGVRVFLSPAPFDHAKLCVVDRAWVLVGSSNWDPRSLRLNFELDIECHDPGFAARVDELVAERRGLSRAITLRDVDGRSLPLRLRDGLARLLSPYL
jgi:cardiolipin synthase